MPTDMVRRAAGRNAQRTAWIRREAYDMRLAGKSLVAIGEAMAIHRTGAKAGKPYAVGTVHGWMKAALAAEAPKDKALRVELQQMEEARLNRLLVALEPKIHPKPCKHCNQGDVDTAAVESARKLSESRRKLLGLDEPSQVAVLDRTREAIEALTEIYKLGILDYLPRQQAIELLHFLEGRVCEATGEAPPADLEVKVVSSPKE